MRNARPVGLILAGVLFVAASTLAAAEVGDAIAPWQTGVQIHPVAPDVEGHTIHTYFNASPESPDGRHVLCFASTKPDGEFGDIRMRPLVQTDAGSTTM